MSVFRKPSVLAAAWVVTAFVFAGSAAAAAANWQTVVAGKTEVIEFDKTRILRGASGVTGWSRILLGREVNDPGGVYNTIQAQNHYDCERRRFTTLRRAYFNGDSLVREEAVSRQRANRVQVGSIDERLLNEACGAAAASAADGVVGRAALDSQDPDRPNTMHADMRSQAEGGRMRAVPVADASPKPVTPPPAPQPVEPAKLAPPAGEKHRLIALPPIDKAAADQAAASAGLKPAAPAAATAPGVTSKPGAKPEAKAEVKPEPKPAAKPEPKPEPRATAKAASQAAATTGGAETADERRLRELQYATSGPRRVPKKKPADEQANPAVQMHVHWSYEGEGAPANWAKLKKEYATCATGQRQSPIDIRDSIKVSLETIRFDYKPTQFRIVDNGHTLQVSVGEGIAMHVMGKRYDLIQFHFHRPSEERINGKLYDMVVHLVHKSDEGQLAVVAVLLEKGGEHLLVQTLWNNMPLEKDMDVTPAEVIDLMQLLPENRAYWTYMGSLTTPPCTEGVLWMVMKQPLQVSADQIAIFTRLFRNNARPIQPGNGRLIKESR